MDEPFLSIVCFSNIFISFISGSINFFQSVLMFSSSMDKINGFLNDTEVSEVEYGGMEVPFPNIAGIISIFW